MLEIPHEIGKLNFIIDCRHSFGESLRGGIIVLQKLAFDLVELGHNVYMPAPPMYSDKIVEIPTYGRTWNNYINPLFGYDTFTYPIENTITIYPGGYGNPYIEPAGEAMKYLQALKIEISKSLDKDSSCISSGLTPSGKSNH